VTVLQNAMVGKSCRHRHWQRHAWSLRADWAR